MPLPLLWHTHWNWCNLLCIHSEVYYTSLLTYFSMNSQLHIHAHVAPHVQCVYYLLVKRIAHRYPALKSRSVPWDVLRTVWFSPALGSSCLSPATLALNETSTCTGHSLLLLIEQLAWRATPALLPFSPLSLRPFTFSLLPAVGFTSAHLHFFFFLRMERRERLHLSAQPGPSTSLLFPSSSVLLHPHLTLLNRSVLVLLQRRATRKMNL